VSGGRRSWEGRSRVLKKERRVSSWRGRRLRHIDKKEMGQKKTIHQSGKERVNQRGMHFSAGEKISMMCKESIVSQGKD